MIFSSRARVAWLAALLAAAGCDAVPDLNFDDGDAGPGTDATLVGDSREDAGMDSASAADAAALDAPIAAEDAGADGLACLPNPSPPAAGCCSPVLPCVGLGCMHCADCNAQSPACRPNQFCCAHVSPQGAYMGVQCSPDGKNCP